jgi:primary-amine oxidase
MAVMSQGAWLGGSMLAAAIILTPPLHAETRIAPPASPAHPMDGLTADEIRAAIDVLRSAGRLDAAVRVVSMTIDENAKDEVRAWRPGQPFARRALATLLGNGQLYEARIDLAARSLAGWNETGNRRSSSTN